VGRFLSWHVECHEAAGDGGLEMHLLNGAS
jgi:hypothetical protein